MSIDMGLFALRATYSVNSREYCLCELNKETSNEQEEDEE